VVEYQAKKIKLHLVEMARTQIEDLALSAAGIGKDSMLSQIRVYGRYPEIRSGGKGPAEPGQGFRSALRPAQIRGTINSIFPTRPSPSRWACSPAPR